MPKKVSRRACLPFDSATRAQARQGPASQVGQGWQRVRPRRPTVPANSKPTLGAPPACASAARASFPYASITSLKFSAPAIASQDRVSPLPYTYREASPMLYTVRIAPAGAQFAPLCSSSAASHCRASDNAAVTVAAACNRRSHTGRARLASRAEGCRLPQQRACDMRRCPQAAGAMLPCSERAVCDVALDVVRGRRRRAGHPVQRLRLPVRGEVEVHAVRRTRAGAHRLQLGHLPQALVDLFCPPWQPPLAAPLQESGPRPWAPAPAPAV